MAAGCAGEKTPGFNTVVMPAHAGCAEVYDDRHDPNGQHSDGDEQQQYHHGHHRAALELRCDSGVITSIEEAVLGRLSGRCSAAAFLTMEDLPPATIPVPSGYFRSTDATICTALDFRGQLAMRCSGHAQCAMTFEEIMTAVNAHRGICDGHLLRAAARFRCGTDQDPKGGVGYRQPAWFEEEATLAGLAEERENAAARRGYQVKPPVLSLPGTTKRPTACAFGYEADFAHLRCVQPPIVARQGVAAVAADDEALADDEDATSIFDGTERDSAPSDFVIARIIAANYGRFTEMCSERVVPTNIDTFPEMTCGFDVRSLVEKQCVGRQSCTVYAPPTAAGGDPCIGQKKGLLILAVCGPHSSRE